jgi:topoisomerase IA-like protein
MSTKQLLAEIERGIKALQKAQALVLKAEAVAPKAKATTAKTARAKAAKATKVPAKKATKGGMSRSSAEALGEGQAGKEQGR